MNLNRILFAIVAILGALFLSTQGEMMIEETISFGLFLYILFDFINSIGRSYRILDIPILLALFQCMLMPAFVYHVYNTDEMVNALGYDMGVTAEVYYGFMFPAIIAFILGAKIISWTIPNYDKKFLIALQQSKQYLTGKGSIGTLFIIIGAVTGIMKFFLPSELYYFAYLLSMLLYVGVLYTYLSDNKNKKWYLIGGSLFILFQSIAQGMFGELVYTLALSLILILLGRKISTGYKFSVAITGFIFVLILQSIKADYRDITWRGIGNTGAGKSEVFLTLIAERIGNPGRFIDIELMFPTVNRFNQGGIVGKVMVYVPHFAPFAEGETIFNSLAASFVPRLLWPDKPKSGGHFNIERFTGFKLEGYSMNISPMGEAYGNFGVDGGIVFMFFYGLFYGVIIISLLHVIKKKPTLVLWFPVLFLNSVQIETDILMCVNSLIKNLLFIYFCYWAANKFLRLKL